MSLAVLRLADAELIPFEFDGLADTMQAYLKDLKTLLERKQEQIAERNRQIEEGVFQATLDPRRPTVAPREGGCPAPPQLRPDRKRGGGPPRGRRSLRQGTRPGGGPGLSLPRCVARVNAMLIRSERLLLSPEGLPRRPWFKHLLYAPGVYAGYGAKTMPGRGRRSS